MIRGGVGLFVCVWRAFAIIYHDRPTALGVRVAVPLLMAFWWYAFPALTVYQRYTIRDRAALPVPTWRIPFPIVRQHLIGRVLRIVLAAYAYFAGVTPLTYAHI